MLVCGLDDVETSGANEAPIAVQFNLHAIEHVVALATTTARFRSLAFDLRHRVCCISEKGTERGLYNAGPAACHH